MKRIFIIFRVIRINFLLMRYGLDQIFLTSIPFFNSLHFLAWFNPYYHKNKNKTRGERIRLLLQELGPIYVKLGQVLSTRRDLVPEDICHELERLQDNVAPFPSEQARKLIEKEFKKPIAEIFQEFTAEPLASASIAQVHEATLHDGSEVVVKVLRPHIHKTIKRDIELMDVFAFLLEKFSPTARLYFRPREIVEEFRRTTMNELDLYQEAGNAGQLRLNFEGSKELYVPKIYWDYTHRSVMVMEKIKGIPVTNIEKLREANVNLQAVAERGVRVFFTQVFRDCFFHADMHPGNIFISPENPDDPQYIAIDFGIVGTLSEVDQRYIAENLLAFFNRNYRRVAQLHIESGWVDASTRVDELESAIRCVFEPIAQRPLKEIYCAQLLVRLFQVGRKFKMVVQPQLLLLQKTLFNIEGMGRDLYPELNLWDTAKPFLEKWMAKQIGPIGFARKLKEYTPFFISKMPELPELAYHAIQYAERHITAPKPLDKSNGYASEGKGDKRFNMGFGLGLICTSLIIFVIMVFFLPGISKVFAWLGLGCAIAGLITLIFS